MYISSNDVFAETFSDPPPPPPLSAGGQLTVNSFPIVFLGNLYALRSCFPYRVFLQYGALKEQCHEIFDPCFFLRIRAPYSYADGFDFAKIFAYAKNRGINIVKFLMS